MKPRVEQTPAVRAIWARARIRDLEDTYATATGRLDELAAQIVATSLRFGVLSRFTAFVAVDEEQTGAEQMAPVAQPVERVSGWLAVAYSAPAPPGGTGAMSALAGMAPPAPRHQRHRADGRAAALYSAARTRRERTAARTQRRPAPRAPVRRAVRGRAGRPPATPALPTPPETVTLPWLGALLAAVAAASQAAAADRLRLLKPYLAHATRSLGPDAPGGAELTRVEDLAALVLHAPDPALWEELGRAVAAAKVAIGVPDVAPLDEAARRTQPPILETLNRRRSGDSQRGYRPVECPRFPRTSARRVDPDGSARSGSG